MSKFQKRRDALVKENVTSLHRICWSAETSGESPDNAFRDILEEFHDDLVHLYKVDVPRFEEDYE